jgi:hypothetical protein
MKRKIDANRKRKTKEGERKKRTKKE